MSHVTYEWVMSHMNESCHTCDRVRHLGSSVDSISAADVWESPALAPDIHHYYLYKVCSHVTYEWVMSHIVHHYYLHKAYSHVTHEWVMSHMNESCHTWMSHVTHDWVMSHMNESCHTWMSHVTHEWVMSHMTESCHIWISRMSHGIFERVFYVLSCKSEPCRIWMSHVTYKSVSSDCAMTHTSRCDNSTCEWVMAHMNVSCHTEISYVCTYCPS